VVVSVTEIVDVVSLNRVDSVVKRSSHRALAIPSEVCLLSRCTRVQNADGVSIICPRFSEGFLKLRVELLEGISSGLLRKFHLPELFVSNVSAYHRLHYVSSVKAIHAVNSDVSCLLILNYCVPFIDLVSLIKPMIKVHHEVLKIIELVLDLNDETRKVLPLHLFAFGVEVEPDIFNKAVF